MSNPDDMGIFAGDEPLFEQQGRENGTTTWSAREFAEQLGYKDYESFRKTCMNRATQVCLTLDIVVADHFQQDPDNGDVRLSRFACYLCSMNGDPKKLGVATAQAYFATFAEACRNYIADGEQVDRVLIREEISEHEKTLSSTVKKAGVENYAFFQSAGYLGLYNMTLRQLKKLKGVPSNRTPLDFMGKDELAANLFRVTQTEAKIRADGVRGQAALERTAKTVGKKVRKTMHELSGQRPEDLPAGKDIKKVKSGLRSTKTGLQRIDKKKPKK